MSNERDELAGLLFTTDNSKSVNPWSEWEHCKNEPRLVEYVYAMADAILAAGYRKFNSEIAADFVAEELRSKGWVKPRQVSTVEELDALLKGDANVIVMDEDESPFQNLAGGWSPIHASFFWTSFQLHRACGPNFTVLHEGASE